MLWGRTWHEFPLEFDRAEGLFGSLPVVGLVWEEESVDLAWSLGCGVSGSIDRAQMVVNWTIAFHLDQAQL